MKKLNRLGLLTGITAMAALSFSLGGCSDDPEPAAPSGGTGPGASGSSTGGSGGSSAGSTSTGGGGSSSGSGGSSTAGSAGKGGSGGSGGASGGSGGAAGGSGGAAAGSGGSGGATGGSGGSGGGAQVSQACAKLCSGADSIGTICAASPAGDVAADLKVKATCETRCMKEADTAKVACWQTHATNAKNAGANTADVTLHCGHAGGKAPCTAWPN